jgi:hypothetical protein
MGKGLRMWCHLLPFARERVGCSATKAQQSPHAWKSSKMEKSVLPDAKWERVRADARSGEAERAHEITLRHAPLLAHSRRNLQY